MAELGRRTPLRLASALAITVFIESVATSGDLYAQVVPPTGESGRTEKRFEPQKVPRSSEEPVLPEMKEPGVPKQEKAVEFILSGVVVQGATVYEQADLQEHFQEFIGKEVTLADLEKIAASITARYRNDGYILTRVVVPSQTIKNGIARLRVIEGYIDKIMIEGNIRGSRELLRVYANQIAQSRPLNSEVMEGYLLLMRDLPGVYVRSVLQPSKDMPGAANLHIAVEHEIANNFASFDNRGSRYIGPFQIGLGTRLNSAFGAYERTGVRVITTTQPKELKFIEMTHEDQLGGEGTVLETNASYTRSHIGFDLSGLSIISRNLNLGFKVRHPFIRSRAKNLSAALGFDYRNSKTKTLGDRLTYDRIRAIRGAVDFDFIDRLQGINLFSGTMSRGLEIFHSTERNGIDLSRPRGFTEFTKFNMEASRLQSLQAVAPGLSVLASASGQYSFQSLLASEEFGVGGARFGRAYDPSEITGDHGVATVLEVRYGREREAEVLKGYQVYTFYDFGAVWNKDTEVGENSQTSVASTGVGVRLNVTDYVSGSLEFAAPLTGTVNTRGDSGDEPRVLFAMSARY